MFYIHIYISLILFLIYTDLMQAQLSGAMAKVEVDAKLAAMSLKSPTSQTYPRRLYDRHSGVDFLTPEAAIYTDPAVALAQKRARLQANTGNRSTGLYQTRPKSMVSETDSNLWNSSTVQTPTTGNSVTGNNNNNNNNNNNVHKSILIQIMILFIFINSFINSSSFNTNEYYFF
jgi:hypothetical protein